MEPALLILTSSVKTSNSVIFAIQVTLEDADDNNNTQQNGEKHALSSTFKIGFFFEFLKL